MNSLSIHSGSRVRLRPILTAIPPAPPREDRRGAILSGARNGYVYPLREWLAIHAEGIGLEVRPHPGYGNGGADVGNYLRDLSRHRVSVATASRYRFALRKILEGVACGCVVVTDLPEWDPLPVIDPALERIDPAAAHCTAEIAALIEHLCHEYPAEACRAYAAAAASWYDYRARGRATLADLEAAWRRWRGGGS